MKFIINQTDLLKGLNLSSRSLLVKSNLPILSNVLISTKKGLVEVVATNLETATRVLLSAKIETEGKITLPGRAILEFVSQLDPGDITIETLGEEVAMSSGAFNARFATIAPEEFPAIPQIEGGKTINLATGDLTLGVDRVAFCAASDESRPILTGILCEIKKTGLEMVATDGFRLGYCRIKIENVNENIGLKVIVPAKALFEVAKMAAEIEQGQDANKVFGIQLIIADNLNQAVFKIGNVEFTTRLIEGVFPAWEKLIPSTFTTSAKINKGEFTRVIKIASIFARESGNIIKIKLDDQNQKPSLMVSSTTAQVGSSQSKIEVGLVGHSGEIAFNFRYLLEALAVIAGDEVSFEMNESLNPGRLTSMEDKESYFHIIMPVRLQN
jgi:DNA polymerase-3 subunit beta